MRKKVLLVQPIHSEGIELLEKEVEVIFASGISASTLRREIKGINGVIVRTAPFPGEIIQAADRLEVIGRHGVGVDNIDIKAASKYKIPVVYTPGVTDIPVAEHAFGFMVTLAKRYLITDRALREGKFKIREEFSAVDLNEKALFQALKEKWIAGAALDVFVEEPPPSDHPLFGLENIVLSPHMASLTRECVVTMARVVAQGVLDVLGGKRPQYIVNPDSLRNK